MCVVAENQLEISVKGALPFITAALLHKNTTIQHQAVWGIANLSTHRNTLLFSFFLLFSVCSTHPHNCLISVVFFDAESCRAKFDDVVSTALIDLLKTGPVEVKAQSIKALANLGLDDNYRNEIGKLGGCAVLLDIVQSRVQSLRLYDHSLVALLNLSIDAYCRDAMRHANGLGVVMQVLRDTQGSDNNLITGLKLFTNLAFTEENRTAFIAMKAVPLITSLRSSPVNAVSQQAQKASQMLGLSG